MTGTADKHGDMTYTETPTKTQQLDAERRQNTDNRRHAEDET